MTQSALAFDHLLARIRGCRICVEQPAGRPLPHAPRPVVRGRPSARLGIFGQAPGTRVHASGIPFTDASGDRLRQWLGIDADDFYNEARVAVLPMGFCFPGLDTKGADLPPRRECAPAWRAPLIAAFPNLELALLVGGYAQAWHLGDEAAGTVTATVADWRAILARPRRPRLLPLPHPSWRNTGWLKANPWFGDALLPVLQGEVRRLLAGAPAD